mmetsp:Transcript_447/g.1069  ORF Transcript_447/g.1069 Transcript_447/m.1069 type:complete len:893 (+) Transcript_447:493-3171(+)|eukprot:CAMPEP_0171517850 /NCGR_PEP_ID=MMETSP0959-20130129/4927_1 /TAXON_ID=87120 /ORGANISM="Aurantiochytrium limacinum, Strain ATCCMYA-1381" /LENGTH=892 /DNA_ID=CAMNT_0012056929 /DNA_START=458 /DNA_END=3136 /DNA_ORIENTATION=-
MSYYSPSPGAPAISRPKTYDPDLARRTQEEYESEMDLHDLADRIAENQRRSLRQELGFDDDDDFLLDSEDDEEECKGGEADAVIREELQQLQQRYMTALRELHETGEKERRAAEQVAILKRMSKTQVTILKKSFKEKLGQHHTLAHRLLAELKTYENSLGQEDTKSERFARALAEERLATDNFIESDVSDGLSEAEISPSVEDRLNSLQRQLESLESENSILRQSLDDLRPSHMLLRSRTGSISNPETPKMRAKPSSGDAGAERIITDLPMTPRTENADTPSSVSSKLNSLSVEALRVKLVKALKVAKITQTKLANVEQEKVAMLALLNEAQAELERRQQESQAPSVATTPPAAPQVENIPATPKRTPQLQLQSEAIQGPQTPPTPAMSNKGEKIKEKFEKLKQRLAEREQEVEEAKSLMAAREGELSNAKALIAELSTELEKSRKEADHGAQQESRRAKELQRNLDSQSKKQKRLIKGLGRVRKELQNLHAFKSQFTQEVQAITQKTNIDMAKLIHELSARVAAKEASVSGIVTKYDREYKERRRLFNMVQELRGNIRVLCRVRPALDFEENDVIVRFPEDGTVELKNSKGREKSWEFDHVFKSNADNAKVFEQVSDLCTSILDGYNVCIFAYGQTGSGKTHTMEGPEGDRGVNFRALDRLFTNMRERNEGGEWEYEVQVSLLEIYNEQIRDLLTDKKQQQQTKKLEVKAGPHGMHVPGLTMVTVNDHSQVLKLMKLGKKNRSVACTDMNSHSSRSHSMLSTYIFARNTITGEEARGKLHLIDLAGSERISKSGVQGARLTEATNINKSLSALGDVIQARANKQGHVPYRNSTLTYLLQDSLSQDSKTLMFVQVSPVRTNAEESFCSLNFAARARTVELGKAAKHTSAAKK